ncbi:hypothetical protein BGW41_006955 [Actinomortierella wolfii]|nr:hypothetical protein BGW41_006955 [Actinomortierella wolfii]
MDCPISALDESDERRDDTTRKSSTPLLPDEFLLSGIAKPNVCTAEYTVGTSRNPILIEDDDEDKEQITPLLFLPGRVHNQDVRLLVDSGASRNFIGRNFVDQLGLTTFSRKQPATVRLADGTPCTTIERVLAKVTFNNDYEEDIMFDVINNTKYLTLGKT